MIVGGEFEFGERSTVIGQQIFSADIDIFSTLSTTARVSFPQFKIFFPHPRACQKKLVCTSCAPAVMDVHCNSPTR